jgi:hypothetical protein
MAVHATRLISVLRTTCLRLGWLDVAAILLGMVSIAGLKPVARLASHHDQQTVLRDFEATGVVEDFRLVGEYWHLNVSGRTLRTRIRLDDTVLKPGAIFHKRKGSKDCVVNGITHSLY